MNKWTMTLSVAAVAVAAGTVSAATVTYNGQIGAWGPTSNGGPFAFTPNGFGAVGLGLHQAGAGRFVTFCLEKNELLSPGNPYDIAIATSAVLGGVSGGNPDPLDARTAWLYQTFMSGLLGSTGFTYSTGTATPAVKDSGDALQAAIWYIEQEISDFSAYNASVQTIAGNMLTAAAAAVAGSWGNSIHDVRVLNLFDYSYFDPTLVNGVPRGYNRQSQLVIIPLPGGAGMATVGMAGLLGLGVIRRRR